MSASQKRENDRAAVAAEQRQKSSGGDTSNKRNEKKKERVAATEEKESDDVDGVRGGAGGIFALLTRAIGPSSANERESSSLLHKPNLRHGARAQEVAQLSLSRSAGTNRCATLRFVVGAEKEMGNGLRGWATKTEERVSA